ncbi:hypothetical protein CYJ76_00195 [Kytococcus schroeteri]|uniref:MotA/TolQ/ExbB proton channel domain-containing protein n=1 Tax=Kytococcus schroeteri TaxID=138300 RepID=A0A2I1PDL3_9MICO|nr:hypothetical protein [Kytococcus schroeteri]PKZ42722.1 hypothetical protein CYJ76_00195 [Kytococcus schroeteri]
MAWYSSAPAHRSVQVLSDLAMAGWTLLWVLVGRAAHHHVLERFAPAERLVESGDRINDGVQGADQRLSDLPLVGDLASGVLDGLLGVGDPVTETGRELLASGERLADTMWLAVTGLPVLTALLVWLPVRLHFAVRSAATAANLRRVDDPEALLALRGLATLPVGTLASIDRDPVAAWRRGDEEVVHELARAQARELGVQLPQRSRR